MALFLRRGVIAAALGILLFCISCEKHPLGQMPEVQREQPDPAKVWLKTDKGETEKSSTAPMRGESSPYESH
jgi:hypothetical protein